MKRFILGLTFFIFQTDALDLTPDFRAYKSVLYVPKKKGRLTESYHAKGVKNFHVTKASQQPSIGIHKKHNQNIVMVNLLSSRSQGEDSVAVRKRNHKTLLKDQRAVDHVTKKAEKFEKMEEKAAGLKSYVTS